MIRLYARVSTDDKGQSIENQFIRLRQWCSDRGEKQWAEYSDEQSGKTLRRPDFQRLISEVQPDDTIALTTPDRYSRTLTDAMVSIDDILSRGHKIMFVDSGISLEIYPIPEDVWFFLSIMFTVAEYFRRHLSTNTKAGIQRKRIENGRWGRKTVYEKTGLTKEDIIDMASKGMTIREIATATGMGKSSVHRILQDNK